MLDDRAPSAVSTADARSPMTRPVRVLEVGGSHVTAASVALGGVQAEVVERVTVPLDAHADRATLLATLAAPATALTSATPGAEWAVALPGPFDYERGSGDFAGVAKFAAIAGVDLRGELAQRLGTDAHRIRFVNDADAYGLGEWAFGDVGRVRRLVCITLGTGVGSAFVDEGRAVTDRADVPPHGYVHLLELDGRPLEDTVSTRAIVAAFARRTGRELTVKQIAAAAAAGDDAATDLLASTMRALGRALAPCLSRFEASALVVGGSMSRSWNVLGDPLREGLRGSAAVVRPSTLLDSAPLLGAAHWLLQTAPLHPTPQENR
ncbi:ROK family protein [Diaminobutyricimonas aerilata]|uniref:ROK family protein n=1 Tax=Diaminobutyricimonas aerilata TaxID=1162967 RepID=UPI001B80444B|nr:ROK family protein [Diaminobutyricimonas aerilata]